MQKRFMILFFIFLTGCAANFDTAEDTSEINKEDTTSSNVPDSDNTTLFSQTMIKRRMYGPVLIPKHQS